MSTFRERDIPYTQTELADEFLREIEEAREVEKEEKYKDALRNLWEKYQDQENAIFNEAEAKRAQFMQKKRTYPVLPWLPYSDKRKRFPVAKRSPKVDKQSKDLEEIFGKPSEDKEKKKRSVEMPPPVALKPLTPSTTEVMPANESHQNHTEHGHHNHSEHKHHKRDDDQDESTESEEQDHEHDDYEGDSEEEYDPSASGEEEDETRKKKRDTGKMKVCQGHLCVKKQGNSKSRQKKSVDWSQYFGLDRKKKSSRVEEELTPEKIDKMDKKLQLIEDAVLSETVKYTGSQTDVTSIADLRRIKENVMSNLAIAYSLEKMRQALNTLRQSIENENHLGRNQIEAFEAYDEKMKRLSVKKEKVDFEKNT